VEPVELVGLSGGVPPVVPSNTVGALLLGQRFRKRMIKKVQHKKKIMTS
jgi:hypothetical protein